MRLCVYILRLRVIIIIIIIIILFYSCGCDAKYKRNFIGSARRRVAVGFINISS